MGGYTVERLLRAADSGIFRPLAEIGDYVTEGQTVAFSGDVPVKAQISASSGDCSGGRSGDEGHEGRGY